MPTKTLATLPAQAPTPQTALSYETAIAFLLFKNWLVCVCVCVQPQRFQVLCSLLFLSSSLVFMYLFYHIKALFQVLYSKRKADINYCYTLSTHCFSLSKKFSFKLLHLLS